MTGPFVPVGILNLIRAVVGIPHHRFNLFVKCSSGPPVFSSHQAVFRIKDTAAAMEGALGAADMRVYPHLYHATSAAYVARELRSPAIRTNG
jgi:hypothetical protein